MSEEEAFDSEIKIIPFEQFVPLIEDVARIVRKDTELYLEAQHNKKITKLLMERIAAANFAVSVLRDDDLYTSAHYANLQRLIQVLQKMKKYSEEITQYNTLYKILADNPVEIIEKNFNELCKEYDDSIDTLNLTLIVDFKANAESDGKILKEEIEDLSNFEEALLESMGTKDKKVLNKVIKQVSDISITMFNLYNENIKKEEIQKKIDTIFNESPLPFKEYNSADEEYSEDSEDKDKDKFRKYTKAGTSFAFKTVEKDDKNELINQIKNQVTIFKRFEGCENIIRFYGITNDGENDYLVTEWIPEKSSLYDYILTNKQNIKANVKMRLKFACDIAKGLNFLNSVKILHRDIRSENILITDQNIAKIKNFKLDKGFQGATGNLAVNILSVRHNSPEVLRKGMMAKKDKKKYNSKTEVYSFGILLWELAECRTPYSQYTDFTMVTASITNGYREPLTEGTGIPVKYQNLVNEAIDQNPVNRPTLAKMLVDLRGIFKEYIPSEQPTSQIDIPSYPLRNDKADYSLNGVMIEKIIEDHKVAADAKDTKKLSECYKLFDEYAKMGNPKAKYWKAYYITKGLSDLNPASKKENNKIAAELFKEVADYDDKLSSEAQLRYALVTMSQNKGEAINYLGKAANNGHTVAMFNIATYYFSSGGNQELGRYYMITAATKNYPEAVAYCKKNNINWEMTKGK